MKKCIYNLCAVGMLLFITTSLAAQICNTNAGIAQPPTATACLGGNNMGSLLVTDYLVAPNAPDHAFLVTNSDDIIVGVSYDGTFDFDTDYFGQSLEAGEYCFWGFAYDQNALDSFTNSPLPAPLGLDFDGNELLDEFVEIMSTTPFLTDFGHEWVSDMFHSFSMFGFPNTCHDLAPQPHCVWANSCNCTSGVDAVTASPSIAINAGETVYLPATFSGGAFPVQMWWEPADFLDNPNSMSPQANPPYTTSYIFSVMDADGCVDSDTTTVVVSQPAGCATSGLTIDAGTDQTITQGSAIIIEGFYTGGTAPHSFTWLPSNAVVWDDNPATWTEPLLETTTFTAVVTDANGCSASDEMTVFVDPPCEFELLILDVGNSMGCWDACNASVTLVIFGSEPEYELTLWDVTGQYDYTVPANEPYTINNVCSYDELFSITSNGCTVEEWVFPQIDFMSVNVEDVFANPGEQATLSAEAGGGTEPYAFAWSNGATTADITVTPGFGLYRVTVTDALGCSAVHESYIYEIGSCDGFAVDPGEELFLYPGETGQLEATVTQGGTPPFEFEWIPDVSLDDPNIHNPVVTQTDGIQTYGVVVTDANGCTAESYTFVWNACWGSGLSVDAGSDITLQAPDVSAQLNPMVSGGTPPYSFDWYPAAEVSDPGIIDPIATPSGAGTEYTLIVTDVNGCQASDIVNVSLVDCPPGGYIPIVNGPGSICTGPPVTLTAEPGFESYTWNAGSTTEFQLINSPGNYCVTVSDANGCTGSNCIAVVNEVASVEISGGLSICAGGFSTLDAGSGFALYNWSIGETTQSISATAAGNYCVTVSDGSGCSGSACVTVEEVTGITVDAGPDQALCLGQSATLMASGGSIYNWSNGVANAQISVSPTATTTYSVAVSDGGCTDTDQVTVFVYNTVADAGPDQTICLGQSVTLTASGGSWLGPSYSWITGSTSQSITVSPITTTTFLVTVTNNGCTDTDQVTVFVTGGITADAGPDQFITSGGSAALASTVSGGTPPLDYAWTPATSLDDPSYGSPLASPSASTLYTLLVTDDNGCSGTDEVWVYVDSPASAQNDTLYVPTGQSILISPLYNDMGLTELLTVDLPGVFTTNPADNTVSLTATLPVGEYTGSYTADDGDGNTFSGQITIFVVEDGDCSGCVWPGDANNDGVANNFDLLPIGVAYGFAGTPRLDQSIDWSEHPAFDWGGAFDNGANHKNADCNGSGEINGDDIAAIDANYGFTHSKTEVAATSGALLFFDTDQTDFGPGTAVELSVNLGLAATPLTEFYGIAFRLNFDAGMVDPETVSFSFLPSSWVGDAGNTITLVKPFAELGYVDAAIVRTDHTDISGSGPLGVLQFVIIENIDGKTESEIALNLEITDIRCIDALEQPIEIAPEPIALNIVGVGVNPPENGQDLKVYPNPANTATNISLPDGEILHLSLLDMTGKLVYRHESPGSKLWQVPTDKLPEGVYFLQIGMGDGSTAAAKVMVSH